MLAIQVAMPSKIQSNMIYFLSMDGGGIEAAPIIS